MNENKRPDFLEDVKKGLLIGGAVGVFGGLFFVDIRRGLILGLVAGFFAVITRSAAHEFRDIHNFIDPSLTDMAESLRNFGEKLLAFLYSPQMIEQRHLSISASKQSELGRLAYEEGVLRSLRLTAESMQAAMDAGKLRQADAFVATQQLFALLEAELLKASLLQQLGEVSPARIRELTARAVAVFMAAYGPETPE